MVLYGCISPESVNKSDKAIQNLQNLIPHIQSKYGVKRIGLFGSFAWGEQNKDSDADIIVEFEPEKATFDYYMQPACYLENIFPGT